MNLRRYYLQIAKVVDGPPRFDWLDVVQIESRPRFRPVKLKIPWGKRCVTRFHIAKIRRAEAPAQLLIRCNRTPNCRAELAEAIESLSHKGVSHLRRDGRRLARIQPVPGHTSQISTRRCKARSVTELLSGEPHIGCRR